MSTGVQCAQSRVNSKGSASGRGGKKAEIEKSQQKEASQARPAETPALPCLVLIGT